MRFACTCLYVPLHVLALILARLALLALLAAGSVVSAALVAAHGTHGTYGTLGEAAWHVGGALPVYQFTSSRSVVPWCARDAVRCVL